MGTVIPFPAARVLRVVPASGERPFAPPAPAVAPPAFTGDVRTIPPAPAPWHMTPVEITAGILQGLRGRVVGLSGGQLLVDLRQEPRTFFNLYPAWPHHLRQLTAAECRSNTDPEILP